MHGWNHLTYSDGIKGRVAIFRTLGFGAPSLGSVGVPGLKVSEQLSWELGSHRAAQGLPIQALHGQHVVPAEQRVAAQPLVVGRHERARRGRVGQAERVADLVRQHHEQVAPAAAAQGPALVQVEVRFSSAGQKGVRQGAPCRRRGGSGGAAARVAPAFPPPSAQARGARGCCLLPNFPPGSVWPKLRCGPATTGPAVEHRR